MEPRFGKPANIAEVQYRFIGGTEDYDIWAQPAPRNPARWDIMLYSSINTHMGLYLDLSAPTLREIHACGYDAENAQQSIDAGRKGTRNTLACIPAETMQTILLMVQCFAPDLMAEARTRGLIPEVAAALLGERLTQEEDTPNGAA